MCYVRLDPEEIPSRGTELTATEWIRLGEQAIDAGTLGLTITGGEPLIRSDFAEIYTALSEMGFWIALQTNLALLDDNVMALLEERPPKVIKSTIYGASNDTYERVCGVKHGLDQVERGIQMVQKAGIPLELVSTVIHENYPELEEMYELAAKYRIQLQHTVRVLDSRRNTNQQSILSSRMHHKHFTPDRTAVEHRKHVPLTTPLDLCGEYKRGGYWIFWNGTMSFCSHIKMQYEPLKSSVSECFSLMHKELLQLYPAGICDDCQKNDVCLLCPAMLYTEQLKAGETCKKYDC